MNEQTHAGGARNTGERLTVIANPRAGGGRAGARRDAIARAVDRAFANARILWTEGPGHATELAARAAPETDLVAALGGDGTCSEVVNGLLCGDGTPVNRKATFTVLPLGTGGDLVRSLQIPGTLERALWVASTGVTLPLDAGRLDFADGRRRFFVNVVGVGANAEVCVRTNRSSKRLGGTLTFLPAILRTVASFAPRPLRWTVHGPHGVWQDERVTFGAFIANGHYCGAGVWVGREGSMVDGLLDVTIAPRIPLRRVPELVPKLYDGRLPAANGMVSLRATHVRVEGDAEAEADGEGVGRIPVDIRVLPRALPVRGGWLRPPGAV
jgi:diacylglycerol kinase (ATP)